MLSRLLIYLHSVPKTRPLDDAAPPPSPTAYSNDAEGKTAEAEEEATDVSPPQQQSSSPTTNLAAQQRL